MYGMSEYNPYAGYYQPYMPHQQFPMQGPPPSPRPNYPTPYGAPPQHLQGQYLPQSMSRSASQASERPSSSLGGQPQTPSVASATHPPHTPATSTSTPAPPASSNFQIPSRVKSKAIVIKNDKGEEINFNQSKKSVSPVPAAHAQSPAIVSSAPPHRAPSDAGLQLHQSESKAAKTDAETKAAFQEQVKKHLEGEKRKKDEEEQKVARDKEAAEKAAEEAAKKEQEEADAKAKQEKQAADDKLKQEQDAADEKARKEQAEAEAAAEERSQKAAAEAAAEAEKAAADKAQADEKAAADKAAADADEEARKKKADEEEFERQVAELEALEREEEERERAYQEKKKIADAEKKKKEAEAAANADEELKRQEREAEERELAKEQNKTSDEDSAKIFASLKKPNLGPGALASESGAATPVSDDSSAVPSAPEPSAPAQQSKPAGTIRPRPAHLKLETAKNVEPAQPTPGMQALKSARFLNVQMESVTYPGDILSPNPAKNQGKGNACLYDRKFLLQFQEVFKEKPSIDWDQKVKETLGDGGDSAHSGRPSAGARTPSTAMPRQTSNRPQAPPVGFSGVMGQFGGPGRTLPAGTTSQERFMQSQAAGARAPMNNPFARPGAPPAPRNLPLQTMGAISGPNAPRNPTNLRKGSSRRGGPQDRAPSRREEEQAAKTMPLTAGMNLAPLQPSSTGWKPTSIGQPIVAAASVDLSGQMAPDMVQRKVKSNLNKMTPENFDKISGQILEIAGQSKNESDGRTLRQVIALTFEKACDEAHWASMYAKFCQKMLHSISNEIVDETIKDKNGSPVVGGALFRKYLLNRCQEEFEKGWQANLPEKPEGETEEAALLSDEYYKASAAKRKGLGLIQFIGELYKLGMLTIRIMHECVMRLLNFEGSPDEAAVESLTKLLRTVGATMDGEERGVQMMNTYFERVTVVMNMEGLPSRSRFMLLDIIDLRKAGWRSKDDAKGPKTIQEIHEEAQAAQAQAELDRARQNTRGPGGRPPQGRGDARAFSGGMGPPPPDYRGNAVDPAELRRMQSRATSTRNASSTMASLGPGGSSLFAAGRSASGRSRLGPPRDGDASGPTSRTNTPPVKDKKDEKDANTSNNVFSALAALETEGTEDVTSPPSEATSPPTSRALPSDARARSKSPAATGPDETKAADEKGGDA
ncbi:hypothetical protein LTR66_009002 [Elasticomyces elasticus]|nr:hypothetical protein LTR66_009002 [Elasticomyces elasticus]